MSSGHSARPATPRFERDTLKLRTEPWMRLSSGCKRQFEFDLPIELAARRHTGVDRRAGIGCTFSPRIARIARLTCVARVAAGRAATRASIDYLTSACASLSIER